MRTLPKGPHNSILLILLLLAFAAGCNSEDLVTETNITDVAWRLSSINGSEPDQTPEPIILNLDALNLTASGFGGCNRYTGSFEQNGEAFSFGPVAATKMFCENTQSVEDAFFASLSDVRSAVVEDSTLTMYDENGTAILSFENGS